VRIWLARVLFVERFKELSKLLVNFFQLSDRMAKLAEGFVKAVGRCWGITGLDHHLIVVVIIDDERGHETCCAGMREGIGC